MKKEYGFEYTPSSDGCAALRIQHIIPGVKVVVVICGDDKDAKKTVMELTREIRSVRPLDGGHLCESRMIESLTPFMINMAIRNGLSDLGVKFV